MSNNLTESEFSSLVNRLAEPVARQVMRVVGDRERPTNTNRNVFQTAHEEMRNLFRFGGRGQGRGQAPARRGSSSRGTNQRYRPYTQQASAGKAIDVVLLLTPNESSTIRGQNRARLHEIGCIIDKFFFHKSWQSEEVTRRLQDAFADRLNDGSSMSFQILKPEGQTLVVPRLAQGEKMSGAKVCDIFAQKTMYLRPERRISVDTSPLCLHQSVLTVSQSVRSCHRQGMILPSKVGN
ncbi:uncharacterized protein [Apostichopus japonicus]|uniref:uncharacterized protein n=1 Tax=Stichopus japonicus TaxID=307972 RepID=UPI003AB394A8